MMGNDKDNEGGYETGENLLRKELRRLRKERRELRAQRRSQRPSNRYLFLGLTLILWGVLSFLVVQQWMAIGDLWKAIIIGIGTIFIVRAFAGYLDKSYRPRAISRLIPGIILLFIGLGSLFGLNNWWPPVTLIVAGIAVLFISWFLQREMERRRLAQETLRESEVKYRHIIDNANSIIMEIDPSGKMTFINRFGLDFFGYRESEILDHNMVGTIVAPLEGATSDWGNMINNIGAFPERYLHIENENLRKNDKKAWIIWTYKPVFDEGNNLKEILCIGIDSTQQKQAAEMASRQLKEQTAMEERTRLARDLHDAVSQTLFSTSLIAEVLPKVWEKNKEEGQKKLEEVRLLTRGALAEMRSLLFELRPAALADADLNDLLRQLCESVIGKSIVQVNLEVNGNYAVPPDVKVAVYRITQEALNNIIKHSGANWAQVSLHGEQYGFTLQIIDNGRGFDMAGTATGRFGLKNMKERADQVKASLHIQSGINQGTEIIFKWNDGTGEVVK